MYFAEADSAHPGVDPGMSETATERTETSDSGRRSRLVSPAGGIAMQIVLATSIAVGVALSPVFTWPGDPFSIVGSADGPAALVFNGGLVLTGLLGLAFAAWLRRARSPVLGWLFALVSASYALAGAFPMPSPLHAVATGIFVFGWLLLWTAAAADWRSGRRRAAAAELVLGTVAVGIWLPYDLGWAWAQVGYAAAEAVSFAAVGVWTVWTALRTGEA